jgi:hypothetical protein
MSPPWRIKFAAGPPVECPAFFGHYTFRNNGQLIDLDAVIAGLDLT